MLRVMLTTLLTASMFGSIAVLHVAGAFSDGAVGRLEPVVVGSLTLDNSPQTALFRVPNMAPGDVTMRTLTMTNAGTLAMRYAMRTESIDTGAPLARALRVTFREASNGRCVVNAGTAIAGPMSLADAAFGTPGVGTHPGDRVLAPAASELLCVQVELPLATSNALSRATTTVTFNFFATEARPE